MKSLNTKLNISTQEIFQLERCGRYDDAIQKLSDVWEDKSAFPDVNHFDKATAAEIILRCGSLIGFLGHNKQIPNAQEHSRDLLTEAHQRFLEIYDIEKIAECENYLALSYWRKGELVEAEVWLEEAFSHNLSDSIDTKLFSHLIKSILTNANRKYAETVENFKLVESSFREYGDYYLNGTISSNLGIAYSNLGNIDESIKYYKLARHFHRKSQHQVYLGTVENNIALLYKSLKRFSKAHEAIDNATNVFKKIYDKTRNGYSLDTKALIYFDEGKFDQALETVESGIEILRKSENADYLVEILSTKVKILVSMNKIAEATLNLFEAYDIARIQISEVKANKLLTEFEHVINAVKSPKLIKVYSEDEIIEKDIELVLPPSISHYEEIEGVWIKNKHLEKVGLKKGSLAIIVKEKVERGDLVAVLERDSEAVICGFYDIDFGIVCLEAEDKKPQLFDENEIQILGKIVGVTDTKKDYDNKMHVEPIEISN